MFTNGLKFLIGLILAAVGMFVVWAGFHPSQVMYDPTDAEVMSWVLIGLGGSGAILGLAIIFDSVPWRTACELLCAFVGGFLVWSGANPDLSWVGTAQVRAPIIIICLGVVLFEPLLMGVVRYIRRWWSNRQKWPGVDHYNESLEDVATPAPSPTDWRDNMFGSNDFS